MPEAVRPPHPVTVLLALANDPEDLARIAAWCRRVHPPFPQAGSALFLWRLLYLAGFQHPLAAHPERFVNLLVRQGWRRGTPDQPPRPGDLYVSLSEQTHRIERVGLVVKVHQAGDQVLTDWFVAVDNLAAAEHGRPYRRNIGAGDYPPVWSWLRRPG